ncbi:MAG: hypothetical protein ACTSR9_17355 [Candidatus Thorarchaeota archaeon]
MKDKIDLVLLVVSLFCVPIVIFFKGDMLFEGFDTHWLFIWGTYSDRYSTFFSFSDTPHYNFAELTSWSLASLWIGVTIVAYFILRKGNPTTFVRDSGLLIVLLVVQVLAPIIFLILAMQGTSYGIVWIYPIPMSSLLAIFSRVFQKMKSGN